MSMCPFTGQYDSFIDRRTPPVLKLLSYADDLEVFLSSPTEWPHLQALLKLYGQASNAKVNLQKTEIVSLSGEQHAEWQRITTLAEISYHTRDSPAAVRYLGYPLYSNQHQLYTALEKIKQAIVAQCGVLQGRHLSVRGKALVTNSLILSKLWHVLRVVPIPTKWLDDIRSIVRKFVLSFWPAPSWDKICLPKSKGGLNIINLHDQQYALQMTFIQRLLRPKHPQDFTSPLIGQCLHLYTGHTSFLPWVLYPKAYQHLFQKLPTMHTLSQLLQRLPPRPLSTNWSGRWFADLPLRYMLINTAEDSATDPTEGSLQLNKLNVRLLVSDVISWSPYYSRFTNFLATNTPRRGLPRRIDSLLREAPRVFQWISELRAFMPSPYNHHLTSLPVYTPAPISPSNDALRSQLYWLPDCSHWKVQISPRTLITLDQLSPSSLRRYWQSQQQLSSPLQPSSWQLYWSLALPQSAITPWWRILHNKLATASYFFRINSEKWNSPLCRLCRSASESTFHFVADCHRKWPFWKQALQYCSLSTQFRSPVEVWTAISTLRDGAGCPYRAETLEKLGVILATLWHYHWTCILSKCSWSTSVAFKMFLNSRSHATHFGRLSLPHTEE